MVPSAGVWNCQAQTVTDGVFGNEDVMESFRFNPEPIIEFVRETGFNQKFIFHF